MKWNEVEFTIRTFPNLLYMLPTKCNNQIADFYAYEI